MKKRVSCISFVNSIPFVEGILHSDLMSEITLSLDTPDQCAEKLIHDKADLGIVPIAVLPKLPFCEIVTNFCISADGPARTVVLISKVTPKNIKRIFLDNHSRTSVMLARILAKYYWQINPEWHLAADHFDPLKMNDDDAAVLIGDKVFQVEGQFPFQFDLANEWKLMTGLPFVFAVWVANKNVDLNFIKQFDMALNDGVQRIPSIISERNENHLAIKDIEEYLTKNISFNLTDEKRQAITLFLKYLDDILVNAFQVDKRKN